MRARLAIGARALSPSMGMGDGVRPGLLRGERPAQSLGPGLDPSPHRASEFTLLGRNVEGHPAERLPCQISKGGESIVGRRHLAVLVLS